MGNPVERKHGIVVGVLITYWWAFIAPVGLALLIRLALRSEIMHIAFIATASLVLWILTVAGLALASGPGIPMFGLWWAGNALAVAVAGGCFFQGLLFLWLAIALWREKSVASVSNG